MESFKGGAGGTGDGATPPKRGKLKFGGIMGWGAITTAVYVEN